MQSTNDELARRTQQAQSTLDIMAEMQVPATPNNYCIWFEYLAGENSALHGDIERHIAAGKPFTGQVNQRIFAEHFARNGDDTAVQQAQDATQRILKDILSEVLSTNKHASEYGAKLEAYSQRLAQAREVAEMRAIIGSVIKDTATMADSSRKLQDRLDVTSDETEKLREQLRRTRKEALIDSLTGLHNRRAFDRRIGQLFDAFRDTGTPFAVIMLDIDFFKGFNDNFGHKVGDAILQILGTVLHECLSTEDFPARVGGEEFVALIPTSSVASACEIAEKIRKRMSEKRFRLAKTGKPISQITVSGGVSVVRADDTAASVVDRADKALYLAKNSGRNAVKSENDLEA